MLNSIQSRGLSGKATLSQVFAMKITISMPTSKVKLQGFLWHLNKLYLIATTGKEHMTSKTSKRYIGGHQLKRFCNSFLPNLWEPERWPYPRPLQPEFCSTSLMGVWYSLRLYCTGLCIYWRIFLKKILILASEMPGFWNASILLTGKPSLGRKVSGVYISYAVSASSPQDKSMVTLLLISGYWV